MIGEENEFEIIGILSGYRELRDEREVYYFLELFGFWFFS